MVHFFFKKKDSFNSTMFKITLYTVQNTNIFVSYFLKPNTYVLNKKTLKVKFTVNIKSLQIFKCQTTQKGLMTTHFEPLFFGVSTNQPSKTSSWKIPLMNHLFVHNTIEFTYHYKHSMSHLSKNCVKFTRYKKMRRTSFHTEGSASTDAV